MKAKLQKKKKHKLWLKKEIEYDKTLTKDLKVKMTNQKNNDWIEENNIWQIIIQELNLKHKKNF